MPKIVDHNKRREEIALIVEDMAMQHGVEDLKVRDISSRAGYSTNIIYHYFQTKTEMLIFTRAHARQRVVERVSETHRKGGGIFDCLAVILPDTDDRRREWHTMLSFWGLSAYDPSVAEERVAGSIEANDLFTRIVSVEQEKGHLPQAADCREIALKIQVEINGLATLAALDRQQWTPVRQRDFLRNSLMAMGFTL